ncbi:hypothetical protein AOLI_G00090880 [Acnodon oligacanthus]
MLISAPQARASPPQSGARCPHQHLLHAPPPLLHGSVRGNAPVMQRYLTAPTPAALRRKPESTRPPEPHTSPKPFRQAENPFSKVPERSRQERTLEGPCVGGAALLRKRGGKLKQRLSFRFSEEAGGFSGNRNSPPPRPPVPPGSPLRSGTRRRCSLLSSSSSSSSSTGNSFGATSPPFIVYLKKILRRYPDGGQILKELIQNADDAGASKTVFIYDERRYGTRSLWSEALGKYQGPALYAFNDAVFTEEDWEGIEQVEMSIKQDDPTKVGRFGIGFNSVYHVTDLPCVFSSKHLAVFDPQKTMFGDERKGYQWSLEDEEDRKDLLEYTDQFKPFQDIVGPVCDCAWEKIISERYFRGTLFRFPLRSEASEISDNLYDSLKVAQLFDSFIADAEISLLFLRNVTSISLMHIDTNGIVNVRMKVSISSSSSPLPHESKARDFQREYVEGVTSFKTVCCVSPSEPGTKTKWLVTTCVLTEGSVPEIDALAGKLSFHPQVDVAFQCDEVKTGVTGRLSCFLPLPNNETNNTGLPVHVNACFGLTDNRRYIKWQEEDQKNDESAMWNELLKKEVLPHVYLKIIQDAIQFSRESMLPASTVYSLWPDLSKTEQRDRWHEVAMEVYKQLFTGKDIFSLAASEASWVAASEAVFPTNNTDTDTMSAVARLLIAERENLVTVPEHVLKAIQRAFPEPAALQRVTPCFVRTVLRKTETGKVSKDDRLSLLEYVLSDGKYEELHGLQLLPLSDGSFRSFTNEEEDTALIDNEEFSRMLLPFCKERFLGGDLNSNTVRHLRQVAKTNPDLYKIINLDAKNVAAFAKEHLPRDWKETQGHVKWNYAKDGHPPKTWLTEFWKFLNAHWEELYEFIGMPLIPLEPLQKTGSSTLLAKLEENPTLIFQSSRGSTLPDQVQKVVKIVGGTVIKKDQCLKHHDIESYVLTTSPKNVLQVLLNTDSDKVISCVASASLHEKEEFKTYVSSMDCISNAENQLLSALPLFRLMSGKYVAVKSRRAVILKSNPPIPTDLPVPETIVQCENEADRRLLILLKVDLLDAAQLAVHLVDCIERKAFNKEEEKKIMTWILHHGNVLLSQSEELLRKSRNLSFIETEHGERKRPSSVFDPTNKIFQDLFEEDFFLPQVYRTQVILQSLRQLGLRTKEEEISPADVLRVASQIQKLHIHSRNKAFKKADALVGVLNRNDLLSKFSEGERRDLLQMQWVPCQNPNSVSSNSKNIQKRGLYKPAEIRASEYFAIVGHVMPLTSELRECVCQKLDLFIPPPAEKVLENLCVLGSMAPLLVNPDSDYKFKNKVHSTYKFMQENTEYFREEMNKKCIAWLWCQNEFVSPRDVVLVYPDELDLSLYIKKVPEEFLQYADMLKEFGVKETLSDEEIEDIFQDIKQSIDDRDPPFGEPSELKVSIAILDWMRKHEKPLKNSIPVPVRAENQNFTLEPLKNTVYCDISDEGLEDLRQDKEEFHVIHEEVLGLTAKWLKVPFLSTRILKPQFIRPEEECPGIEQCGQTEPITQRIKNILKEYDEVNDIFKELLQNAEDARASTCGFLLDFRTHPPESLIDDGMALCNGPCLWAFNNELFSEEDWKNIVRVGSASKENKIEKIGNFGLGFNAVYHLTDIPSILSGKSLLILDPNVTHLEKHIQSKANPGIKLDLFQERLFRRFPGQFRSYQGIFGCDLTMSSQNYYEGTLIKLPFRTSEEVCKSEISCKVFDQEGIHAFQQHFTDDAQNPLLFLKNINSVSLQIVSEDASTPPLQTQIQTLLRISKEVVCSMNISNEMHVEDIRNTMENLDTNCHKVVDCFTAHIVEIVYEHADRTSNQYWLIYSCLGTKDSMRMFHRELQECRFSLPVGGVAVPLQKGAENVWSPDESCAVGQAFCFLPLPIETGLPVHLNGSFAVTSNRKALWQTGTKLEWNKALLQDTSATAYITTLLELKKMAQNRNLQNYDYYTFWPDAKKVSKAFQPLVCAFYSAIAQRTTDSSLELFSNGQSWCSVDEARFLAPEIERNEAVGELAIKVFLNDTESNYCPVPLPLWVRNSFIQCDFREVVEERTFHWVEFYQVVFKILKNMDPPCRNALLLNAIDLNDHGVDALLKSNPCIPTQKSGNLQFISKLVNPSGKVACLYDPEEGRFLDGTKNDYFMPRRIQRLSGLGMLSDTLSLEDVVERAKTISRVWTEDQKKAQKCLQCLFDCMKEHLNDDHSSHWETLKHISFLPAQIIDQANNVTTRLKKPSEVYSYWYCDLVNMTEFSVDPSDMFVQPNNPVLTKLGVNKTPPVKTVLKQLKEAHDRSDTFEKSLLLKVAKSCYNYLNKYLIDGGDPAAIIDHAQSIPFVLIEGHFVSVGSVAKSEGFEEKPYLYVLPAIFSQFENLWNCVGIKNKFTAEQFDAVLQEMSTFPGPLSKSDLHTCLSIVIKGLYEAKVKLEDCLLPDEKGVLTHASKLNYNDSPWMPVQAGVKLCHKLLPRPVACHFGVETTSHHTLKHHLVDGFCPFTREFGQHEKLTIRIKNIIDAYPSKKDILKELLQNADDAEATEIHFVWDKRRHKTEKLFGEKWKLLQGPALCVYNNKTFSDEDLMGIQQLGEGGKHGTLGRAGKFGLGFNSVYHLTDCPSILTGDEKLCVSDPNLKYVESATKESPGKLREAQLLDLARLLLELRQKSDYKNYKVSIVSALRGVQFIRDIHGCLQMASHFFDDDVYLYKVMLPKERFVPMEFWKLFQSASAGAKSLLKDLGLKHEVSEEEIIEFAHRIESDSRGKTDLDVLKNRSSALFNVVLDRIAQKKSQLMQEVATIKFVFPVQIESTLCDYHKAFAQGRDVVAIEGSLLDKDIGHQCLIWTAMPVLPSKDWSPRHIDALKCAGAVDEPPSEKVMQNLKNICMSLCNTNILVRTRTTLLNSSYAYLQSLDFDASVLAGLPLILTEDDTNLVKASQAVLSLTHPNDFRPYLYPIQGKHAMYAEFFKKIGVAEKPTITQLCTVLQEIHTECCNKTTLQPNQQATVKRAVEQLFCLIQEDAKGTTFPKNTLYLPSTDGKLYESSTLFFNDTVFQAKRLEDSLKTKLELLEKLNHCHLGNDHYEHQKLLKLLPQKIRPKLLSQVISEHLVDAQVKHCDYRKECEFSGWFEKHLSSYAFRHGLICLIREQSNGTVSQTDAARMCEITFGKIQITCCTALQTELLLYREPLDGTQTEAQVYVQKQQGGCTFYLKHNDSMALKAVNEVTMHLTKEINSLLQNILNSLSLPVLGQLLLCENMEDVERTLEQNGIHNTVSEGEGLGACPSPGSPIPEEWHDSLDMSPLNNFEKGEYVGFRKDESKSEYVFAIIVERLDELPGGTRRNPPRYKIQIGSDEFTDVSALDLYQFKREARAGSDEFIEVSSPDIHPFRRETRSASVTNDTCTEIDIMPKPATASQKRPMPKTLEEVKREIDQSLKEIWNMSPEDKWKALRRLYLRWHPDKNLNNPDLANEAFKYLKNKIDELQQGKTKCSTFPSSNGFRDYWSRWNEEARSHRRGRERFYQNNSRQYYNFWSYYRETPRPNREEAKRWYRQAQFDLIAAQSETTGKGSPEWCLFKVHQAVEKALIATEYRRSGQHSGNCSIASLAQQVSRYSTHLGGIPSAVVQLSALGVDAKKTQYPNYHTSPSIPHEQFKSKDARKAVNIATELLTKLGEYITE